MSPHLTTLVQQVRTHWLDCWLGSSDALTARSETPHRVVFYLGKDRAFVTTNHPPRREESHRLDFTKANRAPALYQPIKAFDLLVISILPCATPAYRSKFSNSQSFLPSFHESSSRGDDDWSVSEITLGARPLSSVTFSVSGVLQILRKPEVGAALKSHSGFICVSGRMWSSICNRASFHVRAFDEMEVVPPAKSDAL